MIDSLEANVGRARARAGAVLEPLGLGDRPYGVVTLHRPATVDDDARLASVVGALGEIGDDLPLVFPVHPRTRARLASVEAPPGLVLTDPLGYLDFLGVEAGAQLVLTDSGGVQEETTVLGVACLTLRDSTERPITVTEGTNTVVGTEPARIVAAARRVLAEGVTPRRPALWDGHAGARIADVLLAT
jgi:UDP-N-acetylglucosamine 2-epimerase (non-hydrolysing)